ncbi:hypothetical protein [Legionella worsleiensis]|uniref:Uncharacterized protein n=1 Tax=Legionella worsleiensis TaxID=45076 RepID=A0A0W1AKP3_9GAMM|nr:hypothetical protein [Legionella worsleiensis]KTD81874.1 hypothetical protein Lwor_0177 [Legionella worsleiensis]STY30921.1 Uncharacterised protein [Legionella worsleiensis]
MKITFDIDSNFKFHLNEALYWMNKALKGNDPDKYKYTLLFSAFCIELGLVAAALNIWGREEIFKKDKTIPYWELEKKWEGRLEEIIIKSFSGLEVWDTEENTPRSSVTIDKDVLKKTLRKGVINQRNKLVHSEGEFDTSQLVKDATTSLLLVNIMLPDNLKFDHSLSENNIEFILNNNIFANIMSHLIKEFVIFTESEGGVELSTIDTSDLRECSQCGNDSLLILELDKLAYLCQLCLEHGYLGHCIQCDNLILPSNVHKWDDNGTTHICDYCFDDFGK